MALAIALVVLVVASVLFHFMSPWWATPLASNWKQMDDTLTITLVITGIFFVVINLFVGYIVWRFRHRERGNSRSGSHRAAYQPEDPKLELWLVLGTTIGVIALLAPGLFVYAEYVRPPREALIMEVVGQQWQWAFRFPGKSGVLGTSDPRFVTGTNPLGLNPDDPRGQDNIVLAGPEVHLPLNRPVKVLLRSKDVLHDFYVPPFRARMNMVPGMVTSFWFTPTKTGRFEILCAQLCGVGHYNMRGMVVVEEPAAFDAWLARQQTFAMTQAKAAAQPVAAAGVATGPGAGLAEQGRALAQSKGCVGCHSIDGSPGVGPSWKGLFGKTETFADGSSAQVDAAFLKTEITDPQARLVKGFGPVMPKIALTDEEIAALTAYIQANGSGAETAPQAAAGAAGAPAAAPPTAAAEAGTYTTSTATGVPPSASPPAPAQAGATK
ncbi:cytochrome c oxidase subunit II [Cupriavidus sp. IDO]|uniref:cytochrome c oxidase subunit II n=1 Tax=Cupriavidus sp. IDO TaxID=1539142 RepID=UPI000578F2E4|nr:cytochrome c oxidase subunit II [Cupriavidus sp. IDO]KWR82355.1 cytochrome B [Cupriavidus sp. IDO]